VQLECVRKYPDKIKDQLDIFDREICAYFAVDRNKPQVKKVIFQDYSRLQTSKFSMTSFYVTSFICQVHVCICNKFDMTTFHMTSFITGVNVSEKGVYRRHDRKIIIVRWSITSNAQITLTSFLC
jgi:hypothetical protein